MNKYQEALNFLCDHAMEYIEDFDWEENDCGEYYPLDKDVLNANKSVLQELVDKAELKKPVHWKPVNQYHCPVCDILLLMCGERKRYCPNCGQSLDWGDDK